MASQNFGVGECTPMQQRALPSAIDDLDRAVSGLETTLYNLTAQLHPILDEVITDAGNRDKACAASAPVHHSLQINDVTARIRALSARGNDILSRLHV